MFEFCARKFYSSGKFSCIFDSRLFKQELTSLNKYHISLNALKSVSKQQRNIYLQRTVINNVHPNLKSEIEKPTTTPSGLSLSLLDLKVTISKEGNSSFEFYKSQPRNHYLSTINQLSPPNQNSTSLFATSENALRTDVPQIHLQYNT